MLLILIMLLPIIAFGEVVIISNFPLRKTNLEKVINLENYKEMVEIIRNVEDVKDAYLVEEENRVTIYIERYPIIKRIHIKGNVAVAKEEILSYLGFYEGMPLRGPEFNETDVQIRIKRLYMDKGFLDAHVGVTIEEDKDGYVYLYIGIDEGPIYFTESGVYKGSSYDPSLLDSKIGLVKGRVFKESLFKESIFSLQDFYTKEGYWDSFAYYEGIEKLKLNRPFYSVLAPRDKTLARNPLKLLGSLSEGISNLFSHPIGTLKALIGRGYVARPVFQIIEGKRYKLSFDGASFFTPQDLTDISGLEKKGVDPFSLEEAKENILKAYHRKGFFDVEVYYEVKEGQISFRIKEGERYKTAGSLFDGEFYDEEKLEHLLRDNIDSLVKEGYNLAEGNINKEVLKEEKKVRVYLDIKPGKRQVLKDFIYEGDSSEVKKIFSRHKEKLPTIFNSELVESLNLDIQRYFLKKGFMEGDFETQVKLDEDDKNIYYTYIYTIKEGPIYKLGETIYYGYENTTSRELSYMTEKAVNYSESLNDKTLHNMLSSGIFTGVYIDTFVDKNKKTVHRLIQLSEDKRGVLDFSLGYNTEEKISLEAFLGVKNIFGIGLSSGLKYRKTGKRELYDITFEDRFIFSSKYWFKSDLFKNYEEHKSYNLNSYGFNLQLGYRITGNTSIGPVFSLLSNKVDGQRFNIRKYGIFLIREFKDDLFSPNRIHYDSLNLSFAEGDAKYTKFDLSTFYLIPLKRNFKLSFKVAGGVVSQKAPIFERFFLGGLRDLRGYSFEEIGQPNGGRYYAFGRLELMFPIKGSFVGVIFGDSGSVGDKLEDLSKSIKSDFGGGIGINTPIGPIRLDVAFPFDRDWIKKYKVYLSVGYYY
uniref:Outer membrane protein assembly factor n=1 Tax=Hydrogenobacter sp. TaxID=2152829 RepID=A0A7C2V3P4_9AQUI